MPKRELLGLEAMEIEKDAFGLTPKDMELLGRKYAEFVSSAVEFVRKNLPKHNAAEKMPAEVVIASGASAFIAGNFAYSPTTLLSGSFSAYAHGKKAGIDCDTSAIVVADVLRAFGVESAFALFPNHLMLKLEPMGKEVYAETYPTKSGKTHFYDKAGAEKRYGKGAEVPLSGVQSISHFTSANAYMQRERYAQAIDAYTKFIEKYPNVASAYYSRGGAYMKLNRHMEAIRNFTKALEIDPNLGKTHQNRGVSYMAIGKYEEAIADFQESAGREPKNPKPYYGLGDAYFHKQDFRRALENLEKALALNPGFEKEFKKPGHPYLQLKELERRGKI